MDWLSFSPDFFLGVMISLTLAFVVEAVRKSRWWQDTSLRRAVRRLNARDRYPSYRRGRG